VRERNAIIEGAYHTILDRTDIAPPIATEIERALPLGSRVVGAKPRAVIFGVGDANPALYGYWAARDLSDVLFYSPIDTDDLRINLQAVEQADFIVICEPDSGLIADFLPSYRVQRPLIEHLQRRRDFRRVAKYTFSLTGKSLFVFQRVEFSGWAPISGMGPLEGPIHRLDDRVVIWGYGPAAAVQLQVLADGAYDLYWEALSQVADQETTVLLDGREIDRWRLADASRFASRRLPVTLSQGGHTLEFRFSRWDTRSSRRLAVLFRALRLERADEPGAREK
jgi:hypothetical protein